MLKISKLTFLSEWVFYQMVGTEYFPEFTTESNSLVVLKIQALLTVGMFVHKFVSESNEMTN